MFGTAAFGQPYFGQHIQCGGTPTPPAPPSPSGGGGIGSGWARTDIDRPFSFEDHRRWVDETNRRHIAEESERQRQITQNAIDEADLEVIALAWISTQELANEVEQNDQP